MNLHAIGLANGHGGRHLGCEAAVKALQSSKILSTSKIPINWREIIQETVTGRHLSQLEGVAVNSQKLASAVNSALQSGIGCGDKEELLVVGGDHSCAIGTWSGVASAIRPHGDIGLIWVDAHLDAHTPESSPTGNLHGQPVAHLLGFGNQKLTKIGDQWPKLKPNNLVFVGIRSYEPPEQELLHSLGVKIFYDDEVAKRGIHDVMNEAIDRVSFKTYGFGLSIDLDGFRVEDAPAVGTPEAGGIIADEFLSFIKCHPMEKLLATEIVEFLPERDDTAKTSEKLVRDLVEHIYLPRFTRYAIENELEARRNQRAFA
uniref:Arginase n=2 Tax=Panagrolaimus sp. JU765 TaxID=591449 RepID=A0AC34R105_9BILA